MIVHLIPTPETFAAWVREEFGPSAVLHPANRLTACGKRMGNLSFTTDPRGVTCKTCTKAIGSQMGRPPYMVRVDALLEAADLIASKDHREDLRDDDHSTGWRHALNEAEADLRRHAREALDAAEGIER